MNFFRRFMQRGETARDEILAIGVGLLAMAALFQLVDGAQAMALGMLRGVQDTKRPMIYAAISYWVIGFPVAAWLGLSFLASDVGHQVLQCPRLPGQAVEALTDR